MDTMSTARPTSVPSAPPSDDRRRLSAGRRIGLLWTGAYSMDFTELFEFDLVWEGGAGDFGEGVEGATNADSGRTRGIEVIVGEFAGVGFRERVSSSSGIGEGIGNDSVFVLVLRVEVEGADIVDEPDDELSSPLILDARSEGGGRYG